jgi:hypothetical protein
MTSKAVGKNGQKAMFRFFTIQEPVSTKEILVCFKKPGEPDYSFGYIEKIRPVNTIEIKSCRIKIILKQVKLESTDTLKQDCLLEFSLGVWRIFKHAFYPSRHEHCLA